MSKPDYEEVIPPGGMWSMRIRRNRRLRFTTLAAGANVSLLAYNDRDRLDRLNIPDTLKALHTARLHAGHVLMSDMGRSLLSIVADSTGWHDPLGGLIDAALVAEKFGPDCYQNARNAFHRNGRDNFLIELGKHGLGEADIVANLNLFSKVVVDDEGKMSLIQPGAPTGSTIEFRADLDVLVVVANCPHPLHPGGVGYPSCGVKVELFCGEAAGEEDACRLWRPECGRALALSERECL